MRKAVEERKFSFGGKDIPVTVSLGVVAIPESGITEHNAFLAAADKALYEAKRSGRNRVCVAGSEKTPNDRESATTRAPGRCAPARAAPLSLSLSRLARAAGRETGPQAAVCGRRRASASTPAAARPTAPAR